MPLRKLLREPMVHFLAAGAVLFAAGHLYREQADPYRIVMAPERQAQLASLYELQFGVPPDETALAMLVERDVQDEMLFRQGLALGLDKDDEIVRRRVVQKMQFLLQDVRAPAEPDEVELHAYYETHAERYLSPLRVTFSHIYFAAGQDEEAMLARAHAALGTLAKDRTRAAQLGDLFPDQHRYSGYEPGQVYRVFGRTDFAEATLSAPVGQWVGPLRSGYGWHLLHVAERQEAYRQPLAAVRDKVRTDYLLAAQRQANLMIFDDLAQQFTVVRPSRVSPSQVSPSQVSPSQVSEGQLHP